MTDKEALKQMYQLLLTEPHAPTVCLQLEAIAREALAQPEQEPVAWMHIQGNYQESSFRQLDDWEIKNGFKQYPLYATPPQRTEQEPTQRKPLTNGEIYTAYIEAANQTLRPQDERIALAFARAIEAAHGIKGKT
jgi:hypothetical protein